MTQLLARSGLAPLRDKEYEMVYDALVCDVLPAMERKVRETRKADQGQNVVKEKLGSQRGTLMEGAATQDENKAL